MTVALTMLRTVILLLISTTGSAWLLPVAPGNAFSRTCLNTRASRLLAHQEGLSTDQFAPSSGLIQGRLTASDAIPNAEISTLVELIQSVTPVRITGESVVPLKLSKLPPGVTGRVAIIDLPSIDEEILEEWQGIISQEIDEILYSEEDHSISQPILLSFNSEEDSEKELLSQIEEQISTYALAEAVENHHTVDSLPSGANFVPSLCYEVDGAMITDEDTENPVWDTSSILVFDDLVSSDLRARLLEVVSGPGMDWDEAKNGPDPSRWSEGGLIDLPGGAEPSSASEGVPVSYGLTDDALEELCQDDPPPVAFQEFEKIMVTLFAAFTVTRLPEAVLGAGVTPLTANAPCFGQRFSDHIDADPFYAPPSPWTDVYGRYANRAQGKPRFVSCLVYLNEEWNAEEYGAPTRFYDVATDTAVDVSPKPGRLVIMDQDITHTVVAPLAAAGKRPRYSLVWKLILHPNRHHQDMRQLSGPHQDWPEPTFIGSAKR